MTPAQEAKLDKALAWQAQYGPILDRLEADYLTKGKGVRQVIVHDEKLDKDQAIHDRAADKALGHPKG